MYGEYYGFHEKPFSLLPDPDFLFPSHKHQLALDVLEMAALNQSGFCVISGEIGTGKTTLVRELLNRIDPHVRVGLISNTHDSYAELLNWILGAFDLAASSDEVTYQHRQFTDFVIEQYARGRHTLLIIDEAQNLSLPAMEQLRMLSNINSGKDFVLQIILTGQSELREKLKRPELTQFAQRIAIDYHLVALDEAETLAYIKHRVTKAGGPESLFDNEACRLVYQHSKGIPRAINRICDLALVYGYGENVRIIDAMVIGAVARDHSALGATEAAGSAAHADRCSQPTTHPLPGPPSHAAPQQPHPAAPPGSHNKSQHIGGNRMKESHQPAAPSNITPPDVSPALAHSTTTQPPQVPGGTEVTQSAEALRQSSERASAEKILAEKIAAEKAAAAKAAITAAAAELDAARSALNEKLLAEKHVAEKAIADREAAKQAAVSRAAAESTVSARQAAEQAAALKEDEVMRARELTAAEKLASEEMIAESIRREQSAIAEAEIAKAAAEKALAERIAAEKAASAVARSADAALKKALSERVNVEKIATERLAVAERTTQSALAEQTGARRAAEQKRVAEQEAIRQAENHRKMAQQAALARLAAEQQKEQIIATAKLAAEKADSTRSAAEHALTEQLKADRIAAEKRTVEKVALAKVAAHTAMLAKQAAEKAEAAKVAALKEAHDKEAAAQQAARKAAEADAAAQQAVQAEQDSAAKQVEIPSPVDTEITPHPLDKLLVAGNVASQEWDRRYTRKPGRRWAAMAIAAAAAGTAWLSLERSGVDLIAEFSAFTEIDSKNSGAIASMKIQDAATPSAQKGESKP